MGIYDKDKQEQFTPFTELCHFADEFGYEVLLEKPFVEMQQMFLIVTDKEGNRVARITLEDIACVNKEAANLLNDLAKEN